MKIKLHYVIERDAWAFSVKEQISPTEVQIYKVDVKIEKGPIQKISMPYPIEPNYIPCPQAEQIFHALVIALAEAGFVKVSAECEGELKATKIHLADMQKAFAALLSQLPGGLQ